jgi:PAS domain S-box-containing protein
VTAKRRKATRRKKPHPDRPGKKISHEEQFRLLVEGAEQYAMFLLDEDNFITFWSRGAEKLFGWSAEEVAGKKGDLIFTPEDRKAGEVEKEFGKARRDGCAIDRRWHMQKSRSRVFVDGLFLALKDPNSRETRGFAKICRDASEQYETSEALRRAHRSLERKVRERTKKLTQANVELKREVERRQALEREILRVSERERLRISQDLHDTLCQELTATALFLKSRAEKLLPDHPKSAEALSEAAQSVNQNVGLARDLAHDLHPFDVLPGSLPSALRSIASRTGAMIPCRCECTPGIRVRDENVSLNLYRIAQEAVNNVLKYAGATQIVIGLKRKNDKLVLYIRDDGVGFRLKKKRAGLGIHLMTYRADMAGGELSVKSQPGRGTVIECRVPAKT